MLPFQGLCQLPGVYIKPLAILPFFELRNAERFFFFARCRLAIGKLKSHGDGEEQQLLCCIVKPWFLGPTFVQEALSELKNMCLDSKYLQGAHQDVSEEKERSEASWRASMSWAR